MRPALQRLLKRPSSLYLLRDLISTTHNIPTATSQRCPHRLVTHVRRHTNAALGEQEVQESDRDTYDKAQEPESFVPRNREPVATDTAGAQFRSRRVTKPLPKDVKKFKNLICDHSEKSNLAAGRLEFGSRLGNALEAEALIEKGPEKLDLAGTRLEYSKPISSKPTGDQRASGRGARLRTPKSLHMKPTNDQDTQNEVATLESLRRISTELTATNIFEVGLADPGVSSNWRIRDKPGKLRKRFKRLDYGPWDESKWPRDQIEFESNLNREDSARPKLVDNHLHRRDLRLWACLLDYRQRIYGPEAVRMYWQAVQDGVFELPVTGPLARVLWLTFLNLGFQENQILHEIWNHANQMLEGSGRRWSPLYTTIVQHMLLSGRGGEAKIWHDRLFEAHPPIKSALVQLCRTVAYKGDLDSFAYIYASNNLRTIYSSFIQNLCEREEFVAAAKWHFILVAHGDLPKTSMEAEPLVQFMAVYNHQMAVSITQSLVEAGVSFATSISLTPRFEKTISRELMNRVHGDMHRIPVKEYNDSLGARWFATRWISLDVAMSSIHALGIQRIGPLSLQAIALRDPNAASVVQRIDQLRELEISIGTSLFSRAVEHFARNSNQEFLEGLLNSDQHPDALEDRELQDNLLVSYRQLQDWANYRRTLAIRVIGSKNPKIDTENIILRSYINPKDSSDMLASLRRMQVSGTPVKPKTISRIISGVLQHRRSSHRPSTPSTRDQEDDLNLAITILKDIVESGSFVPAIYWRDIIKRLGMLGRFEDLEGLCEFLASKYGPANRTQLQRYRIPNGLPTNHHLHPFQILFPKGFQAAVVEWGIMYGLRARQSQSGLIYSENTLQITGGIELLKRLHRHGVRINIDAVRDAILNRLIIYYAPGMSNRLYNRVDRARNTLTLDQMASQIDAALGRSGIVDPRLGDAIQSRGLERLQQRILRQRRAGTTRDGNLASPVGRKYLPAD